MTINPLDQLSLAFSVKDISTEKLKLKRADDMKNAKNLFSAFDIIPFPREGSISGYFSRENDELLLIESKYILSDGTSIFKLPHLFQQNRFYFVMTENEISGYVHYSDLNKSIVKIPFFALFQTIETKLWNQVKLKIDDKLLSDLFLQKDVNSFIKRKKAAEKDNIDLGWEEIFSFPYILRMSRHLGFNHLSDDEIKLLKETRNKVSHSDRNLVANYSEIPQIAKAYDLFMSLLEK